jgi:hypothetical protein
MTTDDIENPKKTSSWNPFRALVGLPEAMSAAKAGASLSGFVAAYYVTQVVFFFASGSDTFGNAGTQTLIFEIAAMVAAAFVTWRIMVAPSLWATVVASAWFWLTLVMTFSAIANGQTSKVEYWVGAAFVSDSILSIRGSWKLRSLRRAAASPN